MEYILTTHGLCKRYGRFTALEGLEMHIPAGSVYGFVGKNGAGKTTLIRLICGLQRPTAGEYVLCGAKSGGREAALARRRMGAVVEGPAVYPGLTAAENLRMQYRVLGMSGSQGIQSLLRLVGLEGTGRKKAGNFSLGMRQRLGIAVALAGRPEFLVLDEPTNGLDPQGIVQLRELIGKLNRKYGITVLVSSHALDQLSRLATCYGFLHRGRMLREVAARELEDGCRGSLRVRVTDSAALARCMEEAGIPCKVSRDGKAEIFADVMPSRLVMALEDRGCQVLSIVQKERSLEEYYMDLLEEGGDRE